MKTYTIRELANVNSYREGENITARTLSRCKHIASRNQMFVGTVLTIEDETGYVLSTKIDNRWHDTPDAPFESFWDDPNYATPT